jgi:hypothetical protein
MPPRHASPRPHAGGGFSVDLLTLPYLRWLARLLGYDPADAALVAKGQDVHGNDAHKGSPTASSDGTGTAPPVVDDDVKA